VRSVCAKSAPGARRHGVHWCGRTNAPRRGSEKRHTGAVKDLLNTFDSLTASEKYEAASRSLRRVIESEAGEIPEDALVAAAEQVFLDLDARESGSGLS